MSERKWLSRIEFSSLAGVSLSTTSRLIKADIIASPYLAYVGRRVLISAELLGNLSVFMEGKPRYILKEGTN